jgi:Uma2 family endonuclease
LVSPFDVRLFPQNNEDDETVVQPDVLVVCDKSKLSDGKACRGAPDLVVEVVSPGSKIIDLTYLPLRLTVKRELYRSAGVKEYWVVGEDMVIRWDWSGKGGGKEVKDEIVTPEGKLKIRSSLFEALEVSLENLRL